MGDLKVENTSFPTSLDTATLHANGDTITAQAANGPNTAIIAIETELGTGLKGTMTNLAARLGVNLHTDGGLLLGTAFPGSPPVKPHFFWRTDETKLYVYNTATASYNELLSTVGLANYVAKTVDTTITATHTFNPSVAGPPFILGANAQNQKVTGLDADKLDGMTTATASTASTIVARDADGDITAKQLISDVAIGTAPLVVTSTTEVANLKAATATLATTATTATQVTDGTNNIRTKIINIGDWNMDSTISITVAHNLTFSKIRNISASIIKDDSSQIFRIDGFYSGQVAGGLYWDNTNVTLLCTATGIFDSVNFDSTSFNRGHIVITYVE